MIPKPGGDGKMRRLGIPTVTDRVVQAALKLVLEPIFEADFVSVSYGFRPRRRVHDAIAEIHHFGTSGYRWVLDADIEACFDTIDHTALLGRVRSRVKDKRVLALVRAFLKAGLLTEFGPRTPVGSGSSWWWRFPAHEVRTTRRCLARLARRRNADATAAAAAAAARGGCREFAARLPGISRCSWRRAGPRPELPIGQRRPYGLCRCST